MNAKKQYTNDDKLNARIQLHDKYSTNKAGWTNWVFSHYHLQPNMKVLELGCGNGYMWKQQLENTPQDIDILLTDISEGMVKTTENLLSRYTQFQFKQMDILDIEYPNETFDMVIANHMLYHVNDRQNALQEVKRVLKPNGKFITTTIGENNMMELQLLLNEFESSIKADFNKLIRSFSLENGESQLNSAYKSIKIDRYIDSLHITDVKPLVDYILSLDLINEVKSEELTQFVNHKFQRLGYIDIKKDAGIFICTK